MRNENHMSEEEYEQAEIARDAKREDGIVRCDHDRYSDYFERCEECGATVHEIILQNPEYKRCDECTSVVPQKHGKAYKDTWLCDDCHDERTREEAIAEELNIKPCEDCGDLTLTGRFYKYEPSIWLCDGCHDERMREEDI